MVYGLMSKFFVQNGKKYADKAYAGGLNQRFLSAVDKHLECRGKR